MNPAAATGHALRLVVLGRERIAAYPLPTKGSVTLGRDPCCEIVIDDERLCAEHALISCAELTIEDLGTASGTWVRGIRLAAGTTSALRCDELVQLGPVAIVIQHMTPGPPLVRPASERPASRSLAMRRLDQLVDRIAVGTISVLIVGETGVGKQVLAETIHRRSTRAGVPFVRLDCAGLTEAVLDAELLERASGGTIFLDEIGELSLATQLRLLCALEAREVIDVRVIAATHRDLEARIEGGSFREDLYFRLNGITLHIPPLRERRAELEPLARGFVAAIARKLARVEPVLSPGALDRLMVHDWPGNIRELRNCIERAVLVAQTGRIEPDHILIEARRARGSSPPPSFAIERQHIIAALGSAAGNQKVAAQLLQISRRTLINKLDRLGIDRPRKRR